MRTDSRHQLQDSQRSSELQMRRHHQPVACRQQQSQQSSADQQDPHPPSELIPTSWWTGGLVASAVLAMAILSPMLGLPAYEPLVAVIMYALLHVDSISSWAVGIAYPRGCSFLTSMAAHKARETVVAGMYEPLQ